MNRAAPPLRAPLRVCLWLTHRCNLRCRYCYAAPIENRDAPIERTLDLCDELLALRVFDFVVSGGEPFLHPQVLRILEWFLDRGVHVGVLTNGLVLGGALARQLARLVNGRSILIQVSIDSADPIVNDRTRGGGLELLRNIRELIQLDLPLQLSTVVSRANIADAHRIIDAFYPAIKRFQFLVVQRTHALLAYPELLVSEAEALEFWARLEYYAAGFPKDLLLPSLRTILRNQASRRSDASDVSKQHATFSCASCSAGITHVDINADFDVFGCDIARARTWLGNVRSNSFASVWSSEAALTIRSSAVPACHLSFP